MTDDNSNRDSELGLAEAMRFWTDLEPTSDRPGTGDASALDQFLYDIKPLSKRGRPTIDYPAKVSPSIHEITFAAGFYEGEGFIGIDKSNQVTLAILQNDREILDRLSLQFGGVVRGPYKNPKGNNHYHWTLVRERAIGFMFTIYTFLSKSRRNQFKAVLAGNPIAREYVKYSENDKAIDKMFKQIMKVKHEL